ncbi:hypothetical protein [Solitalea canadensis]|uniref:HMA domain-containing protein n=1 Tax=Solitalea canadensis (strain ATCC 29591 / DSM 3403 / JCM 21819 / LMG 8368 / NBRC 15130 / NCIMB 12057 / USAM 9D) TaxID=929556 RepID=H8KSG3_SOLCM|nr:hypothetical protein [Solitalea canadensis]AFD08071.1 hypothetical protein Solca_3054 [Solitalea canadensis DSM 3403]
MKTFRSIITFVILITICFQSAANSYYPEQSRKGVVVLHPVKFKKTQGADSLSVKISGDRLTRKQAQQLTSELQKQKGVVKVQVNYELNTAQISFVANQVTSNQLSTIINSFKSPQGQSKYKAIIMYDSTH